MDWGSIEWPKLLAAALVGWLFNEASHVIRLRREERRAIGRLLSDLIIIRRHILSVKEIVKRIRELNKFSPQEELFFQIAIDQIFPKDEGLQSRYEESSKIVIGIKPLLGFELIAQGQLLQVISRLKEISAINEETADLWEEVGGHLEDTSQLEELINMLAWSHGWQTWLKVKRHVREPLRELPENLVETLKREADKKTK